MDDGYLSKMPPLWSHPMNKSDGYSVSIDGKTVVLKLTSDSITTTMRMDYKSAEDMIEELSVMVDLAKKRSEEAE